MGAAAAIAGVSAVAGIAGSAMAAGAAGDAAKTGANAANQASYNTRLQQVETRGDLLPFRNRGDEASARLAWLEGIDAPTNPDGSAAGNPWGVYGMSGSTFQPTQAQLESTPGYQFDLSQGLKSIASSNAAKGLGVSGAALKGAAEYATGLADKTLQTQAGIFQNNYNNVMNPLMAQANLGVNAAAQTGNNGASNTAAGNNALMQGAGISANGQIAGANAIQSGLNGVGNSAMNYMLMNKLYGSNSTYGLNQGIAQGAASSPFMSGGNLGNYPGFTGNGELA